MKMLALAPGHRLHRDAIAEILWPDAELETAANNLYQILHTIRRMIGATSIALNDDVVRLCPAGGLSVDVDAVRTSRRDRPPQQRHHRTATCASAVDWLPATRRPIR